MVPLIRLTHGLGQNLDQSVDQAAREGITEEELEAQLQEQLHMTVRKSATSARDELSGQVASAQRFPLHSYVSLCFD